jgi:hypothetical protein
MSNEQDLKDIVFELIKQYESKKLTQEDRKQINKELEKYCFYDDETQLQSN